MKIKTITTNDPDYQKELSLRDEVLRKPLGHSIFDDDLSYEAISFNIAAFIDGEIVGCTILMPLDAKTVKMRQFAVAPQHQRKGIGKALVGFSEALAKKEGFEKIVLNARVEAAPFYLKLDYTAEGEEFLEVGIPHIKMYKNMI